MPDLDDLLLARTVDGLLQPYDGKPGVTLGIVRGGALVLHRSAGLASLELGVPIGADTTFRIASVSKQFTCAAILLLAADGLLSLDEPARRYLPDLPECMDGVTVAHLMHNTSGVRDMLEIMRQGGAELWQPCTPDDLMAGIRRQRTLNFAPGSRYLYSNAGFLLLGRIVEHLAHEGLATFLHRRIFTPLGMRRTCMTESIRTPVPGLATGYMPDGDGWVRAAHAFPLHGEGALVSCIEDLALWSRNYVTGRVGGLALAKGLQAQAAFPDGTANDYARGVQVRPYRGLRTVSHGGLWPGYKTEFLMVPGLGLAVVAIANNGSANPNLLAHQVLDALIEGRTGVQPVLPLPSRAALLPLAGCYLDRGTGQTADIAVAEDGTPSVTLNGMTSVLEPTEDGWLAVPRSSLVFAVREAADGGLHVRQDAGHRSHRVRVAPGAMLPPDLAGQYASAEMAATWRFAADADGAMQLHVTGPLVQGGPWAVLPVQGDAVRIHAAGSFYPVWMDGLLQRGPGGEVSGIGINTGRLRQVRYARTN